jgi:hypothetical protein
MRLPSLFFFRLSCEEMYCIIVQRWKSQQIKIHSLLIFYRCLKSRASLGFIFQNLRVLFAIHNHLTKVLDFLLTDFFSSLLTPAGSKDNLPCTILFIFKYLYSFFKLIN